MVKRFRIAQIGPEMHLIWAKTEWFYWDREINEVLKRDVDGSLFEAAYDSTDWDKYYERLKGTPLYNWALDGGGILTFGGRAHIESNTFFSAIADMTDIAKTYLKEHPEFNQLLHDLHVEAAEEMIDYLLQHAPTEVSHP